MIRFITSPSRLGVAMILIGLSALAVLLPDKAPARVAAPQAQTEKDRAREEPTSETDVSNGRVREESTSEAGLSNETVVQGAEKTIFPAPSPADARLIGRLARGMRQIKRKRDHGSWGFCGRLLSQEEQVEISTEIAYRTVADIRSVALKGVSPWGIVSTMYNESGFDACALGVGPRSWAYREGLLTPRRTHISHTREEVLGVVSSKQAKKRFSKSGFDLGLCQVLTRFYRETTKEKMLTVAGGTRVCVLEMQARARRYGTDTPWLFWRGSSVDWYRAKIKRWARLMGAPKHEDI